MKHLWALLAISVILLSCSTEPVSQMTVTGNIKGLKKGKLFLQHIADSVLVSIDSLIMEGDGNFSFKTELNSPEIFYLYLEKKDNNDLNDRITFFGEPGTIAIKTNWNTFDTNAQITGSESHNIWEDYRKVMSELNKKNMEIMINATQNDSSMDEERMDSLQQLSDRNARRRYAYAINFALNNKDSYVAPYIAAKEIPDAGVKFLDSIARVLPPNVANSKYGQELKELLAKRK